MAGYGLLSDVPAMDMLPTAYGDMLLSATNMSLLAVDMDMLLPEPTMVDTLFLTGGYAWWICLSQLEQQNHELDIQH